MVTHNCFGLRAEHFRTSIHSSRAPQNASSETGSVSRMRRGLSDIPANMPTPPSWQGVEAERQLGFLYVTSRPGGYALIPAHTGRRALGRRCLVEAGVGAEEMGLGPPTFVHSCPSVSSLEFLFAASHVPTIQTKKNFVLGGLKIYAGPTSLFFLWK